MLIAKPLARTAAAALHLVEHQQQVAFVADPPQPLEEARRRGHHAPFTQNRLDENAAGAVVDEPLHGGEVAVRGILKAGEHRPEALVVFRLGGRRHAAHGAAVKAPLEGDDLVLLAVGPEPHELDRRLVGLGARVAEEGLAAE